MDVRDLTYLHTDPFSHNQLERKCHQSHTVSQALVEEMATIAKQHGVTFIVANIIGGQTMLDYAANHGIPSTSISIPLGLPGYSNLPHDNHPSAIANRYYANQLEGFLRVEILR
jgi:hypothetical protein